MVMYPNGTTRRPRVSSPYGNRPGGYHKGVDMTGLTYVRNVGAGVCTHAGPFNSDAGIAVAVDLTGYGNIIATSFYAHLAGVSVRKGQRVPEGGIVGSEGATGNAKGKHLHWEIRLKNSGKPQRTVDPLAWYAAHKRATLRRGSRGVNVRALQAMLKIKADGIFGPVTEGAVKSRQRGFGLVVDGVVGPRTWVRLIFG